MFTQHPTLLIGPSDWDPAHAPKAEFDRRIGSLWDAFPQAQHAIVFGNTAHHAELAYLTNFVPKLEPGIALLARDGAHKLLFGGGPNMIGAMKPLTYIAEMAPLNSLAKAISGWKPLLIGGGAMSNALRLTVDDATKSATQDVTSHVRLMMRWKSSHELAAIRAASEILSKSMVAIGAAIRAGKGAAESVLVGERNAIDLGAQDVRTLFSLDGGRTLRPFEGLDDRRSDPFQVYLAVRQHNYWAEGFARFSDQPREISELAKALLGAALATIKHGQMTGDIADAVGAAASPFHNHPVTQGEFATPIGLALETGPRTFGKFETGDTWSVRVGLTDGASNHAIVSAMIAVQDSGCDVLWRPTIA